MKFVIPARFCGVKGEVKGFPASRETFSEPYIRLKLARAIALMPV
jgi:hypothetical protein